MHLRADNNVIQLLLTILFCCVRDDVEEKIGENEQSELTLSLFPSSKQRDEKKPQSNESVSQIRVSLIGKSGNWTHV